MVDLSWVQHALTLMDETLNVHAAEIKQLRAAGVPESQVRSLYPVEPKAYRRGMNKLVVKPKRGKKVLACFEEDIMTLAFKRGFLGEFEDAERFQRRLHDGGERASLKYPGLGILSWKNLFGFYGFPTVLEGILTAPPERWENWPPQNLAYLLSPFKKAADGLTKVLAPRCKRC